LFFLLLFGACFAAIVKGRRRGRRSKPVMVALISLRQPGASQPDPTIGLRDPARPL